jgi:hypothetical protein
MVDDRTAKVPGIHKSEAERLLREDGWSYFDVNLDCPITLQNMFERVILDKGHTIRHLPPESGTTILDLQARYRIIISGTPTFSNIEELCGIMTFIGNPRLDEVETLRTLRFTDKDMFGVLSPESSKELPPLDAVLYYFDPYKVSDTHPGAPLKYCASAMVKHIFNKIVSYSIAEKGSRPSQLLRRVMVRRTNSSVLNRRGWLMTSISCTISRCSCSVATRW